MSELTGIFKLYAGRTLRFPPRITEPGVNANALHFPPRITQPVNRLCGTQGKSVPQTCLAAGRFSFGKPGHHHVKRRMRFTRYTLWDARKKRPTNLPEGRPFFLRKTWSSSCEMPDAFHMLCVAYMITHFPYLCNAYFANESIFRNHLSGRVRKPPSP